MSTPVSLPTVALSPSLSCTLPELEGSAEPSRDHCTWILIDTPFQASALRKYSPRPVRVVKTRGGAPCSHIDVAALTAQDSSRQRAARPGRPCRGGRGVAVRSRSKPGGDICGWPTWTICLLTVLVAGS